MTFFAILTPASFEPAALIKQSQETTQLDADNADNWTTIPGPNNIQVTWSHTLYNVTNPSFANNPYPNGYSANEPVWQAMGPYVYGEVDTYASPQYGDSVTATYTQTT